MGQDFSVGTAVFVSDGIAGESLFPELLLFVRTVGLLGRKAWITAVKLRIRDDRFQVLFLKNIATGGLRKEIGVSQQGGRSQLLLQNPSLLAGLKAVLDKGFGLISFELSSFWVGIEHNLMFRISERQSVVAPDADAVGFQFRTVVIGDVAGDFTVWVILARSMALDELLNPFLLLRNIVDGC
jgi:hypothetical protein